MRIFLLGLFCFFSINVYADNAPLTEVTQIVEFPEIKQKQIYDSSKIWMAKAFNSANSVVQYEDSTTGTIIGKGNMKYPCKGVMNCMAKGEFRVLFTLKIDTKDGKARLTFNDLLLKTSGVSNSAIRVKSIEVPINDSVDKENIENGLKAVIDKYKTEVLDFKANNDW